MRLVLDLDPRLVWKLSAAAERRGVTTSQIVTEQLTVKHSRSTAEKVAILHGQGWCDADIAARLGMVTGTVATSRRRLGLAPNKRYPSRKAEA